MLRTTLAALACTTALASPPALAVSLPPAPATDSGVVRVAYSWTVERIQSGLNALGYDAGPEDGLIGGRTRDAIRQYQRAQDLAVTGEPTNRLLGHIQSRMAGGSYEQRPAQTAQSDDWRQAAPQDQASNQDLLVTTQSQLRAMGHDVRLSGRLDDQTASAIRDYQRRNNLLVTGEPSQALLTHMRQTLAEGGTRPRDMASQATVARVQAALNARGYDAGPADGVMGPGTRSAIRTYQADAGIPVTGSITVSLLERLNAMPTGQQQAQPPGQWQDPQQQGATTDPTWRTAFSDQFDRAASLAGTRWQAAIGDVSIANGALVTDVAAPRQQAPEDVGREMLKSVLGQALGVQVPGGQQADRAVAFRQADLGGAFRLQADIAASGGTGEGRVQPQVNLGVFNGQDAASGYRLLYVGESPRPWRLLQNSGQQVATLASASAGPSLADGNRHQVDWQREADGSMTVTVDGTTVLRTGSSEGAAEESFDGVSLINGGGTWSLHDISAQTLVD